MVKNPNVKGMKTGSTKEAGQCFVGYFVYPNGMKLVTVVLNSEDRYTDTSNLERLSRGVLV
jgi:D-alanyl-D-alanine carboxypeptidase